MQKKIYDAIKNSTELIYVVNCSRRLGKSFTMGVILTEIAIKNPNSHLHFAAPYQNQVKRYLLPIFREILSSCPDDLRPTWKPVDGEFVFPNGSFIRLCGCNNRQFDNLRGNRSDYFIIDEARDIDELETVVNDIALPQLLSSPRDYARIIMPSTPPSTPDHPFKVYAEAAKASGDYSEYTIDESWYPKERIERFLAKAGGRDSASAQREYFCKFVVDPTLQIIPEWRDEYIQDVPKDDFFQFYHLLEGMDVGYRDFTAWVLGYYDWKNARLLIEYEHCLRENAFTTAQLATNLKKIEDEEYRKLNHTPRIRRISDNNNLNILADLSRIYKMPFAPVSKKNGKEWMVNQLREFIKNGKLVIHPRCKMLIASLQFGIWKRDKTDFERSKELGHYDFVDALIYLVSVLVPTVVNDNPIPPLYRMNVSSMMFPNGIPKLGSVNPADEVVRKMFPNLGQK